MKITRIILLAMSMALFAVNFWTIDYQDLWSETSLWAYFRIVLALGLVLLLLVMVRRDMLRSAQSEKRRMKSEK